jgi:SAM-dependent methyltransferase
MTHRHVDYDRLAGEYDRRFADHSPGEGIALLSLARELESRRLLEVGCGTGHWLDMLAPEAHSLVGLDLSSGMLQQARSKGVPAHLMQGDARQIPLASNSLDMVFCVHAIHHFSDARAFVQQAGRILRPRGYLAVVGSNPHSGGDGMAWYVYDYFEGTWETDLERFPSWESVREWMIAAGLEDIQWREVERIVSHKQGREVLDDPFLRKNACSQLALLSEEAYAQGLQRIEDALQQAEARGEMLVFDSVICLEMLVGKKEEST